VETRPAGLRSRGRTSLRFTDDGPIPLPTPRVKLQITCREAAAILGPGWSEYRVRTYVKSGALPGHVVGRRVVIYRHELERWMRGEDRSPMSISDSRPEVERELDAYAPTIDERIDRTLRQLDTRIARLSDLEGRIERLRQRIARMIEVDKHHEEAFAHTEVTG